MTSSLLPLLFRFNPVTVANEAAMLAIVGASEGTIAFRTDLGVSFICGSGDPTHLASWTEMSFPDIPIPTLDAIPAAVADVDLHSHKLKNVADAAAATDALNRETGDGRYDAIGAGAAAQAASAQGLAPTAVKTGAYTAAAGDLVPVDISGGNVTITLPTAPADKTRIGVKVVKVDGSHANSCSIARGGTDVFNIAVGATSLTLSALFQGVLLQYKTSSGIWYVSTADTPLATPLGAAKLGADGTLTGTGGSGLPASVETDIAAGGAKAIDSTGVANGQGILYDNASGHWKPANRSGRMDMRVRAMGLGGQTYSLVAPTAFPANGLNSGFVFCTLAGFLAGDIITNVAVGINAAASGTPPTGVFLGVYSTAGALLASSANAASAAVWTAAPNVVALTAMQSPYTVPADTGLYLAMLVNGTWGTTQLSVVSAPNANEAQFVAIGSGAVVSVAQSGQATLPSPATLTAQGRNNWFSWS